MKVIGKKRVSDLFGAGLRRRETTGLTPAEKAEMRTTALTTEGRAGIPALRMAITQGEADDPELLRRPSSLGETMRPLRAPKGQFSREQHGWKVAGRSLDGSSHDKDTDHVEK